MLWTSGYMMKKNHFPILVVLFAIIMVTGFSYQESEAATAEGKYNPVVGSDLVCGDRLCSEVEQVTGVNQQSTFQIGGISQQGVVYEEFATVDQPIQIISNLKNSQNAEQPFAYLVQIQDDRKVTVSLSWIVGSLSPEQVLTPGVSWTPEKTGTYAATIFVWESIGGDRVVALSPALSIEIQVR